MSKDLPQSQHQYDAIVVGVGGMGSAAAYHLAERGADVLGLEQYDIPHSLGSSHGVSRIIRLAYSEHPSYVPLLRRSYELWRELDESHSQALLHTTKSVSAGPPDSDTVQGSISACEEHSLPYSDHSSHELSELYPGYTLPEEYRAVVQPSGGFLVSPQCIVAHVQQAHQNGATIRARERVRSWQSISGGVRVTTDKRTYVADRLVITAGAWASKLLNSLETHAVPERQVLGWFHPNRPELFTPNRFPVFVVENDDATYYGFPVYGIPGVKVGRHHHFHEDVDPDDFDRSPSQTDEQVLRGFLAEYFSDAAGPTMKLETCLYTNSPDGHFLIDTHPEYPEVVVAAGFSGHGFKFCSVVGEILADLTISGETPHDIELFRWGRFE